MKIKIENDTTLFKEISNDFLKVVEDKMIIPDKEIFKKFSHLFENNDVPTLKNSKDLYKLLTAQERAQAREEINKIFAKQPILKSVVNGRLNKMDEKYPAPATSSFSKDGGGALSLGEILAIVAIACVPFFFLGIAALVIGIVALMKINREGGRSWARILAILAIVFGALEILGLFFWLTFSVFVIIR